jgi:hypothetical protein
MDDEEVDDGKEYATFKLTGTPQLLAKSDEKSSKSLFKQVQWYCPLFSPTNFNRSPDGTCLLSSTSDNALSVYILCLPSTF